MGSIGELRAEPLTPSIGAEVSGLRLADLSDDQFLTVRDALSDYHVLFFRDQYLNDEEHHELARRFGALDAHPVAAALGSHQVREDLVDSDASPPANDRWHTDFAGLPDPPVVAVLRAEIVPEHGGDTLWASTAAAFDALSDKFQDFLLTLTAVHDIRKVAGELETKLGPELVRRVLNDMPPVEHPLVRVVPESGRRAIFLSSNATTHVPGLHPLESDAVLELLRQHLEDPNFQCRFRWSPGAVAIWDERCTVHRALADHYPKRRALFRYLAGREAPVATGASVRVAGEGTGSRG